MRDHHAFALNGLPLGAGLKALFEARRSSFVSIESVHSIALERVLS
jgi:hypothetical protein